jgi:hypothetical protein
MRQKFRDYKCACLVSQCFLCWLGSGQMPWDVRGENVRGGLNSWLLFKVNHRSSAMFDEAHISGCMGSMG